MFILPAGTEITLELLAEFVDRHKKMVSKRYKPLQDAYTSDYEILHRKKKPDYKPDNRIVANFAKYIVDTMNGFFLGNPIRITSEDKSLLEYVEFLNQYNDQDDNNAELSKICDIYGKGYEMYYADEEAELCTTYLDPTEAFMIFDESIIERPQFFVRYYTDYNKTERGSISNGTEVRYFQVSGGYIWTSEWESHYFEGVPATEFVENAERQSIFEPVLTMINAYNNAISEKANDVDNFADAYMKVLGAELKDDDLEFIRDKRVVNFPGDEMDKIIVEFMDKPSGDGTQENLLNRLERLIFQLSMVANISDENFGASSGISLKYKLQAMSNLEKTKERKFTSGMNRRYKVLFSHPRSKVPKDSWVKLKYVFTPNFPANLLEESQIVGNLAGITSKETQLKVLSTVEDVKGEIEKIDAEQDLLGYNTDYPTGRDDEESEDIVSITEGVTEIQGKALNVAQTQSLIAIMSQYSAGSLTEGQAIRLISTAIGISREEARSILNGEM